MRLSFREFHTQFDPTLRRERVPEALFELLGPPPSAKPVFEGKPLPAPQTDAQQEMTEAEQPAEAPAAAQPNGTSAASAEAAVATDTPATDAPAADAPAADVPTAADSPDALEPVPDIAQQLYAQVPLLSPGQGTLEPSQCILHLTCLCHGYL